MRLYILFFSKCALKLRLSSFLRIKEELRKMAMSQDSSDFRIMLIFLLELVSVADRSLFSW